MIAAFGGERWWPLNSEVAVLDAPPRQVADASNRTGRFVVDHFDGLDRAVAARAPYPYGGADTLFLIATATGRTAVLSSGAPNAQMPGLVRWSAQEVLSCECVVAGWTPRQRNRLAGAVFDHYRPGTADVARAAGPGRVVDELTVQVSDQGGRWEFDRTAPGPAFPARNYEEHDVYRARRVADRLPLALLQRYLAATGVPIDDPGYLTATVITVSQPRRTDARLTWSTMADLRAVAGYPAAGIPADLRGVPSSPER